MEQVNDSVGLKYLKQRRRRLDYAFSTKDIFHYFDTNRLKGNGNVKETYKCANKKELAVKIFMDFYTSVIDHLIDTGDTFKFPSKTPTIMSVESIPESILVNKLKTGRLEGFNLIETQGKGYWMTTRIKDRRYNMHLSKNYFNRIVSNANKGMNYAISSNL